MCVTCPCSQSLRPRLEDIYANMTKHIPTGVDDEHRCTLLQLLSPACIVANFRLNSGMKSTLLLQMVDDNNAASVIQSAGQKQWAALKRNFVRSNQVVEVEGNLVLKRQEHKRRSIVADDVEKLKRKPSVKESSQAGPFKNLRIAWESAKSLLGGHTSRNNKV